MKVSRRSFLGAAGAAAATVAVGSRARAAVPVTREEHRVIIIGSGFGGGVAALRLAQAGVPVTVLERGKWWTTGPGIETFPSASTMDKRALWYESAPKLFGQPVLFDSYVGLLDTVAGTGISATCAACVGGGSLVYQGMTLQPSEALFNSVMPPALDYGLMNRVHYPRVAQMLKVQVAPDELVASPTYRAARVFAERAKAAGFDVEKIPMPIDWSYGLGELSGANKPLLTVGEGVLGVNYGIKTTVDIAYLKPAIETGNAQVLPLHNVKEIARASDGRWQVSVDRIDESGKVLEQKVLTCKALILAAGSLGTSKLLVRAKGRGTITNLPDGVGQGWGTNGDRIYAWADASQKFGIAQGGPVVYGSKDWKDPATANTIIQASLPGFGGLDLGTTMLVGFGVSKDRGRFVYNARTDQAQLEWPSNGDQASYKAINDRITKVTAGSGLLLDTNALANSTWHALGGANMGTVCDLEGRVQGQRGLYVLDGALIPGSTAACNPSMTIAAVAERALDFIVQNDIGQQI
ncbi:MAG: GMC oxidoreductase [Polyangiales bacterium]